MKRSEKFEEVWRAKFGSLELPKLHFLDRVIFERSNSNNTSTGSSTNYVNVQIGNNTQDESYEDYCISTGVETIVMLRKDLKLINDKLFGLRTELKSTKFCQEWLSKEVRRCQKLTEGTDSVASASTTSDEVDEMVLTDEDDGSLDTQSVDSAIESPLTLTDDTAEKPMELMYPALPQRRPSQMERHANIPDAPDAASDSESDDCESVYENLALIQQRKKEKDLSNAIPARALEGSSLVDLSGSDESPYGSPDPGSPLEESMGRPTTENSSEVEETSFKITETVAGKKKAGVSDSPRRDEAAGSYNETDIDGAVVDAQSPDKISVVRTPPVPMARKNTWQAMNEESEFNSKIKGRTPKIKPRPSILESKNPQDSSNANQMLQRRLTVPDVEMLNIRRSVLSCIVEGEKRFIAGLDWLEKISDSFKANLTLSSAQLTQEEFDTMFFRIPELCDVHKKFLERLEPKLKDWSPEQTFGDCFKYLASKFYIHEEYVANYKRAAKMFTMLTQENERFKLITHEIRGKLPYGESLDIAALIYSPLQRITKLTLTVGDLLQHTPDYHEDHDSLIYVLEKTQKFIKEVTDACKEITNSDKKRVCLKHGYLVEWSEQERKLRYLFLWSDLLICANKRASGGVFSRDRGQFDCQWYLPLTELSLIPSDKPEEGFSIKCNEEELNRIKKELAELNNDIKRNSGDKQTRKAHREREKTRNKVTSLESQLTVKSPMLPLNLYHYNGMTYTFLIQSDYEKSEWREAILSAKRECRVAPNINVYHINKLLSKFKQGRHASVRSIVVSQAADLITGTLNVTVVSAKGLTIPSELYCCIEVDAYGTFFLMAKTKKSTNKITPEWNEDFDLEVDGAKALRVICYDHTKGLDDEMIDKGQIVLKREALLSRKRVVNIKMERLTVTLNLEYKSSAKTLKRTQSRKKVGVFGVRIGALTKREQSEIPEIIMICAKEVEKRGISELGIYRISGSIGDINRLKKGFETGHRSVSKLVENFDVHAVAGLLKLYLRELPEPLFTHSLYDKLTSGLTLGAAESKKNYMMSVLKSMPEPNRSTIIYLFNHLKRIAANEIQNKMSVHNIATVFGPTLLSPAAQPDQDPYDINGAYSMVAALSQVGVLHYYLDHFNEKDIRFLESDSRTTV